MPNTTSAAPALPRLPLYRRLRDWADLTGLTVKALRAAVTTGELPAIRATPSSSAPILVSADALADWFDRCSARGAKPARPRTRPAALRRAAKPARRDRKGGGR